MELETILTKYMDSKLSLVHSDNKLRDQEDPLDHHQTGRVMSVSRAQQLLDDKKKYDKLIEEYETIQHDLKAKEQEIISILTHGAGLRDRRA